jgi:phosphomannomutase
VGSYFIKQLMKEKKADFGAEASGHYYFKFGSGRWDSGIRAAIEMINQLSNLKGGFSDWAEKLPKYYRSGELNFEVEDKAGILKAVEKHYAKEAKSVSHLDGIKMEFENWWFNLRPSNTEDLVRLNLEAKDKKVFEKELANFKKLLS